VEPQDLRPGSVASAATRPPRRRSRLVVATCIRVPSRRPLVFSKSIPSSLRASRIKAQGSRRSNLVRLEARYDRKHGFYEYGFGRNGCCLYESERSIVQRLWLLLRMELDTDPKIRDLMVTVGGCHVLSTLVQLVRKSPKKGG
jgi:hypothetical protein